MKRIWAHSLFLLCVVMGSVYSWADEVQFDRHIRPILARNCFQCHGPDEDARETELRLDHEAGFRADLGGYQAVVPHSTGESELFRRITTDDPDQRMPPADSEHRLSAEEIALIGRWIEEGALWKQHWSFAPLAQPALPDVQQLNWCRNPIDRFVLAKLQAAGLAPSPASDPRTLVRRLTFDLTGLPPTVEEVHDFLSDTSPGAYEQLVDRLLSSSHYGEHMARFWLDAARYGDTHGLHVDNYREMWPYRDWVIRAFNSNMPYDQFLVEQLAGDLLPEASLDQQIASGFNRCHVTTNEGGSIAEEVYVRNVTDRVSTVGTAILGLTLGCAVCHDHKYDPITQQDFYQLFAFFNNLDGPEMDGNTQHPAPFVRAPTPEQAEKLFALQEQIDLLQQQCEQRAANNGGTTEAWVDRQNHAILSEVLGSANIVDGLVEHFPFDEGSGSKVRSVPGATRTGSLQGTVTWIEGMSGAAIRFSDDGFAELGDVGDLSEDDAFSLGTWVNVPDSATGSVIARMNVKDLEKGYQLSLDHGHIVVNLNGRWPGYAIKVTTREPLVRTGEWLHIFITYDGQKLSSGLNVYVDGRRKDVQVNCDSLHTEGSIDTKKPLQLGRRDQEAAFSGLVVDDLRIYDRALRDDEIRTLWLLPQAVRILVSGPDSWTSNQRRLLHELATISSDDVYRSLTEQRDVLLEKYKEQLSEIATTPVFRERRTPRPAFVLVRGQYDQRGNQVSPQTPSVLPPMEDGLPHDRLALAKWLTGDQHPLTSRVAVNRLWQQMFGYGLVETSEDFGVQGSPPSHPELLDWLACEFRDSDWDVKALLKTIAMSATYQQRSWLTPELASSDPRNRLLARGPRYRLDAEMLRDQALAVSGLLVSKIGGPSVKPPQPDGLWRAVAIIESNTSKFKKDHGPDKVHRRSVYTFWKRTAPPPQMRTFDAPSREFCITRRERTNTPLQALLLLNEKQYMEAARYFAERILQADVNTPEERIRWAFEQATLRLPSKPIIEELLAAYHELSAFYSTDQAAAESVINVAEFAPLDQLPPAEIATWTMIANLLLNLDEVISKE